MYKYFIIILLCLTFSGAIFAFDSHVIHPDLSSAAVDVVEKETKYSITAEQKKWIAAGSTAEDAHPRYVNHFYNPVTGEGLGEYTIIDGKNPIVVMGNSAKEWAFDQSNLIGVTGDYSVNNILDSYQRGDKKHAFQGVGHIIHLVQDMAVPAHTRIDPHPDGDPFEDWAVQYGKINYDNLYYQEINNVKQAFDELADYSYNNFFSRDTISINNVNQQNLKQEVISNNSFYLINEDFKLVKVEKRRDGYVYDIEDFKIHLDYWNMLYPKAVGYSAGTINWFLEEFEKIDKEREEKISKLNVLNYLLASLKNNLKYNLGDKIIAAEDSRKSIVQSISSFFDSFNVFSKYYAESVNEMGETGKQKTVAAGNWLIAQGKVLGETLDFGDVEEDGRLAGGVMEENLEPVDETISVLRVIDGDTIELTNNEIVRYIGINTPELNKAGSEDDECLAWVARVRNMNLLSSGDLKLVKDSVVDKDKYGRSLRYVYVGDVFVNEVLAREGLAETFFCQPGWENCPVIGDKEKESLIVNAYNDAKNHNRGIFSSVCNEEKDDVPVIDPDLEQEKLDEFEELSVKEIDEELKKAESLLYILGGNSSGNTSESSEDLGGDDDQGTAETEIDTFFVSHPDEISSSTVANFSFASSVDTPSFQYSLNDADWIDCEFNLVLDNLDDFAYLIEVRSCQDDVCDDSPVEFNWIIDTKSASSSVVSIEELADGYQVEWIGEDVGTTTSEVIGFDIDYKLDDGDWTTWLTATSSLRVVFNNSEEFNDLCFRSSAYDGAGNKEVFDAEKMLCFSKPLSTPYFNFFNILNLTSSSTARTASTTVALEYDITNRDLALAYYYSEDDIAPRADNSNWLDSPLDNYKFRNETEEVKTIFVWIKDVDDQISIMASSSIYLDKTKPISPLLTNLYFEDGYYFVGSTTVNLMGDKEIGTDKIVFDDIYYNATSSDETWFADDVYIDFVCAEKDVTEITNCIMAYCQANPENCADPTNIYKRSKKISVRDEAGNMSDLEIIDFKLDTSVPYATIIKEFHSNAYPSVFLVGLSSDYPGDPFSYSSGLDSIYWQYRQDESETWQDIELSSKFFPTVGIDFYHYPGKENQNYIFQYRVNDNVGYFSDWSGDSGRVANLSFGESYPVLSEVYGGGGNSEAYYKNDFIEIYNPSDRDISLDAWSVQYASADSNSYTSLVLNGQIKSYGYYLIKLKQGSGGEVNINNYDIEGDINMSAVSGKVALVNNQDVIIGVDDYNVVDFLGYGDVNEKEGHQTALSLTNTTSAERKVFANSTYELMQVDGDQEFNGNGWDTNQNRDDWIVRELPEPQWSSSVTEEVFGY